MFAASKSGQAAAPSGPVVPFSYVPLLLETGASSTRSTTVTDSSTNAFTVTRSGAPSTGWTSPYQTNGYWSNFFSGSSQYLTVSANSFATGGTWTIECWCFLTQSGSTTDVIVNGLASDRLYIQFVNGSLVVGDAITNNISTGVIRPVNQWFHLAVVKNGATYTAYINGSSVASSTTALTSATLTTWQIGARTSTSAYCTGYLSNLRIVSGTAVYTSNFTPSTTPLTAITNTSLLTCQSNRFIDNSTNNFTITPTGTPQVTPYFYPSGFTAPTASPGAGYFNGTTDYLGLGSQANLQLSNSDFTIETWIYPQGTGVMHILGNLNNGTGSGSYWYMVNPTFGGGSLFQFATGTGVNVQKGTAPLSLNNWHHIAVTRSGSNIRLYLDGAQVGTTDTSIGSGTITSSGNAFAVGRAGVDSALYVNGYLSNLRLVVGTALYTGTTYTVPTAPVTAISGTQLLLNLADSNYTSATNGVQNNTFIDDSNYAFPITRNGTPTQGSVTPYWPDGYWSNYFNGTTDCLFSASNAAFAVGTVFTVECWFYPTAQSGSLVTATLGSSGFQVGWQSPTSFGLAATGTAWLLTSSTVPTLNNWNHVAIVRSGTGTNQTSIFLNGTRIANGTVTTAFSASTGLGIGGATNGSDLFKEYISNLRIVKGTAVYDPTLTTITVPTTPLTAIANTSFLACQSNRFKDNSVNNLTITLNNTPRVRAFQPFSPAAPYAAATYGGSAYFNGSTDYLYAPSNSAFAFGANDSTGNFTLECWIYAFSANDVGIYDSRSGGSGTAGFTLGAFSSSVIRVYTGTSAIISSSGTSYLNQWTHVAVVRSSGTTALYINGVSVGTSGSMGNLTDTTTLFGVGRYSGGPAPSAFFNGYISNLRIVKGIAVYTANFTPTTTPLTAIPNTSLLLNGANAAIYDAAVQNNVITVGDAQASTTVSKWSPTSMRFDGTGDWLTAIDNPQLQLGTGDFTIDGWVYLSATGVAYGIISKGTASTGWSVNVTSGNKLQFSYTASNLTGATSLVASTWYYFAVVRSGSATGNLKVYLNGSADATSGGAVTDNFNQTDILYVGASRTGATALNGYLQDVRITKYARTIATPTAAFPTR
jgi:hypothetical protein